MIAQWAWAHALHSGGWGLTLAPHGPLGTRCSSWELLDMAFNKIKFSLSLSLPLPLAFSLSLSSPLTLGLWGHTLQCTGLASDREVRDQISLLVPGIRGMFLLWFPLVSHICVEEICSCSAEVTIKMCTNREKICIHEVRPKKKRSF